MKFRSLLSIAALAVSAAAPAAGETTLNVVTAGDQNMVDYVNDYLGPKFEKDESGREGARRRHRARATPARRRSSRSSTRSRRPAPPTWDIDVAVVHQRTARRRWSRTSCSASIVTTIDTGKLVPRDTAKNALGANVDGYVMPMFHSQIAFAYNPDLVKEPPKSFEDLADMGEEEPQAVRLQRHQGRHVGRRLRHGLGRGPQPACRTSSRRARTIPSLKAEIDKSLESLKAFNQYVMMTPGNAGTLDMLNRGEIAMGPVWVDMFYTWMADGKMNPNVKLELIGPGPARPADVLRDPGEGGQHGARQEIHRTSPTSPEVQADGIVKQFNWYPGHRPAVRPVRS